MAISVETEKSKSLSQTEEAAAAGVGIDQDEDENGVVGSSIGGGISVGFANLGYSVPLEAKKEEDATSLTILDSISGSFLPGKMSALMGPSGSGKTTLLDVLAGRKNSGEVSGAVTYNGKSPRPSSYRRLVGYVEQFDTLVGELSVEQMLAYTAALKLPGSTTAEERAERVDEVIQRLDLESCRGTIIGSSLIRGISGGQAKRVNIGLAMITRPKILLLDEPTSGLDSRTADEVIELLWQLAREGRTVVCTIHSPTGHGFARFDDLHMMNAGKTIYDGPIGEVQIYFEGLGFARDSEMSLPEWLVDLTSDIPRQKHEAHEVHEDGVNNGRNFAALYDKSDVRVESKIRQELSMSVVIDTEKDLDPPSQLSKLFTLLRFRMLAHYKDGQFLGTRFGDKIVFATLILSLYWGIGDKSDAESIQSVAAMLYFVAAICGYGAAAFVPSLTMERNLFYRELADGCYKPITYYASKFIEEGILALITSLVFCMIVFLGVSLQGNFFLLFISYYLTTMVGIILAYAVAGLAPSMEAANAILPTYVTAVMFFGGLFIVFDKIPNGWYWFSWTSFLRYSWGAMMLNQFQDKKNGEAPVFFGKNGEPINILQFYGMEGEVMGSIGACLGLLTLIIWFFSVVGVLGLTYVRHDKR